MSTCPWLVPIEGVICLPCLPWKCEAICSAQDAAKGKFVVVTDRHLYVVHGRYSHCFGLCDCCCRAAGYEDSVPIGELTNTRIADLPSVSGCYETCCPTAMSGVTYQTKQGHGVASGTMGTQALRVQEPKKVSQAMRQAREGRTDAKQHTTTTITNISNMGGGNGGISKPPTTVSNDR